MIVLASSAGGAGRWIGCLRREERRLYKGFELPRWCSWQYARPSRCL